MGFRVDSTKSNTLNRLRENVPFQQQQQNQSAQNQAAASLQQTVSQLPQNQRVTSNQISQMGAQAAANQGQAQLQGQQQAQQQQTQIAQTEIAQKAQENERRLATLKTGLMQSGRQLQNKLAGINRNLKQELFDKEMEFAKDEQGRTLYNDRQLMDWQLQKAQSAEDMANYEQEVQQLSERKMQMLQAAQAKIKQVLEQGYLANNQRLDQQLQYKLTEMKAAAERKMAKEQARRAGIAGMLQGGLSIVTAGLAGWAGAGFVGFNPVTASLGASVGSGIGSIAASQVK